MPFPAKLGARSGSMRQNSSRQIVGDADIQDTHRLVGHDVDMGAFHRLRFHDMPAAPAFAGATRSEEHTSELQSLMRNSYAVFCLKKKNNKTRTQNQKHI